MVALFNPLTALEGSFKGQAFKVANERGEGGRRGPLHQYPDRDRPFFEDLGAEARRREFSLYFVGPLADLQARRFDDLLAKGGPGPLVLPGFRRETALAQKWDYRKVSGRANWVEFAVTFVDPGSNAFPAVSTSWPHALLSAVEDARTAFAEALGDALSFDIPGQEIVDDLMDGAGGLADAFDIAASLVAGEFPSTALSAALSLTGDYRASLLPSLDLAVFAVSTVGLVSSWASALAGASPDSASRGRAVEALWNVYDRAVDEGIAGQADAAETPLEIAVVRNRGAFGAGARRAILSEIGAQSTGLSFASYDDAAALRERLADAFDEEIDIAGDPSAAGGRDDGARVALQDLRAAALQSISAAGANKARLVPYAVPAPRPSRVLAQLFYGGAADIEARAGELAARTGAVHPAFLPAAGERLSG